MRRPWPVLLLLAAALAFLTSLYLPWHEASCGPECLRAHSGDVAGLLNGFAGNLSIDGWSSGVGDVAALSALLLAAVAALALARPSLADRLPLGLAALAVAYFALAGAAGARSVAQQREVVMRADGITWCRGIVVGLCLLLLLLGRIEQREGLESFRIPEILRVDRI